MLILSSDPILQLTPNCETVLYMQNVAQTDRGWVVLILGIHNINFLQIYFVCTNKYKECGNFNCKKTPQ